MMYGCERWSKSEKAKAVLILWHVGKGFEEPEETQNRGII
jgi:hypothetical protein